MEYLGFVIAVKLVTPFSALHNYSNNYYYYNYYYWSGNNYYW